MGPLIVGLVLGGVPLAIGFSRLGDRVLSPEILRFVLDLTPLAIIVTTLDTVWRPGRGGKDSAWRALVGSFSACVPLPLVALCVLMLRFGYDPLSWSNLPTLAVMLLIWSLIVALSGWLLGLGVGFLFRRNESAGSKSIK